MTLADDDVTRAPAPAHPRPYHTPELRSLGLVAAVTQTGGASATPDGPYGT